jgi:DNA-binding CsgD family transcriptional regulator
MRGPIAVKATPRQAEILLLAASGLTDKQIANTLNLSYRTIRTHLERLYCRNSVHGRTAMVARWLSEHDRAALASTAAPDGPPDGR